MALTPPSTLPSTNTLDDIFSDSPPGSPWRANPSDIPHLRGTHSTAGYRDAISASKTVFLQPGFDEGYSLGATFGLQVGYLLGVLEGLLAAMERDSAVDGSSKFQMENDTEKGREKRRVKEVLERAKQELTLGRVFGREYWSDGVWKYKIKGEDDEVTFQEVVENHPAIKNWSEVVEREIREKGVRRSIYEGVEWEAGRVKDERE